MLSRLSAANSHDRLIEEPYNRGPDKRGCTVLQFLLFEFNKIKPDLAIFNANLFAIIQSFRGGYFFVNYKI